MTIEISKYKIPRKIWVVEFFKENAPPDVLGMVLTEDVKNSTYFFQVESTIPNTDYMKIESSSNPNRKRMEEIGAQFIDDIQEVSDMSKNYTGTATVTLEKNPNKQEGYDIEDIIKELEKTGSFNFIIESAPVILSPFPIQKTMKQSSELDDLLLKFSPEDLRSMVDRVTVKKFKENYQEDAVASFLNAIKYEKK